MYHTIGACHTLLNAHRHPYSPQINRLIDKPHDKVFIYSSIKSVEELHVMVIDQLLSANQLELL